MWGMNFVVEIAFWLVVVDGVFRLLHPKRRSSAKDLPKTTRR